MFLALIWWLPGGKRLDGAVDDLLGALEEADRGALEDLLAQNYLDQWGLQRQQAIDKAIQASKQFWTLEINQTEYTRTHTGPYTATVVLRVKLKGEGTPFAPLIADRIHRLDQPFVLQWHREPWKTWSWKLESTANPALKSIDP